MVILKSVAGHFVHHVGFHGDARGHRLDARIVLECYDELKVGLLLFL